MKTKAEEDDTMYAHATEWARAMGDYALIDACVKRIISDWDGYHQVANRAHFNEAERRGLWEEVIAEAARRRIGLDK